MTARLLYALSHNDATKSLLVTMGRRKFTPNCPFPFDDHHQKLIHPFRARPDSPSQTASRSIHVCGHSSHLRTDRRKWRDECSVPRVLRCMQRRANNKVPSVTMGRRTFTPKTFTVRVLVCRYAIPGPTSIHTKRHFDRFILFAQFMIVPNTRTDNATCAICNSKPHLCVQATGPKIVFL